jgi:acetylglutamate kinase
MLKKMGIESKFEGGLRVTDRPTVEIVEMVLAGSINKEIVAMINAAGEWAIGLCGKDGNMVFAEKARKTVTDPDSNIERILDLGFVGEPVEVDRTLLDLLAKSEMIPVIAPVAPGRDGHTYNINADTFAGAIAGSLQASRLLFLTDVPGVLDTKGELIKELTVSEAKALIGTERSRAG